MSHQGMRGGTREHMRLLSHARSSSYQSNQLSDILHKAPASSQATARFAAFYHMDGATLEDGSRHVHQYGHVEGGTTCISISIQSSKAAESSAKMWPENASRVFLFSPSACGVCLSPHGGHTWLSAATD